MVPLRAKEPGASSLTVPWACAGSFISKSTSFVVAPVSRELLSELLWH